MNLLAHVALIWTFVREIEDAIFRSLAGITINRPLGDRWVKACMTGQEARHEWTQMDMHQKQKGDTQVWEQTRPYTITSGLIPTNFTFPEKERNYLISVIRNEFYQGGWVPTTFEVSQLGALESLGSLFPDPPDSNWSKPKAHKRGSHPGHPVDAL